MELVKKYIWTLVDFGNGAPTFGVHDHIMVDLNAPMKDAFDISPRLAQYNVNQPHLSTNDECMGLFRDLRKLWYENQAFKIFLVNKDDMIDELHVSRRNNLIMVNMIRRYQPEEIDMNLNALRFQSFEAQQLSLKFFEQSFFERCKEEMGWKFTTIEMGLTIGSMTSDTLESLKRNCWVSNTRSIQMPNNKNVLICWVKRPRLCVCSCCEKSFIDDIFYEATYDHIKSHWDLYIDGSEELRRHMSTCKSNGKCNCCGKEINERHIRNRTCVKQYVRALRNNSIKR